MFIKIEKIIAGIIKTLLKQRQQHCFAIGYFLYNSEAPFHKFESFLQLTPIKRNKFFVKTIIVTL
jgi:hypothetical protein